MAININIRIGGKKRRQARKPAATKTGQDKSLRTSKRLLSVVLLVAVAVIASAWLWHSKPWQQSPTIPKRISEEVAFPVYSPSGRPAGFSLDTSSIRATNQVITYVLRSGDKKVNVSLQAKPNNFNFDDFNRKQLAGSSEFLTSTGKAAVGSYGERLVVSMEADKTWILLNTVDNVSAKDLQTIAKSFQPATSE